MHRVPTLRSIPASGIYVCPSCREALIRKPRVWNRQYSRLSPARDNPPKPSVDDVAEPFLAGKHGVDLKSALTSAQEVHSGHGSVATKATSQANSRTSKGTGPQVDNPAEVNKDASQHVKSEVQPHTQGSVLSTALEAARFASVKARERIQALLSSRETGVAQQINEGSPETQANSQPEDGQDPSAQTAQQASLGGSTTTELKKTEKKKKKTKTNAKAQKIKNDAKTGQILARDVTLDPLETDLSEVPQLSYGLERVLFNPGFYFLQDPRSRVYNFDPYLEMLMPVSDFDFGALKQFTPSSKDSTLMRLTSDHGKRYCGSTSSMTGLLSHFHYLLSKWRPINTEMLSAKFPVSSRNFTQIQRGPSTSLLRLHRETGVYAIDSDKTFSTSNILSMLGISMEKLLTLETADYEKYRLSNNEPVSEEQRERSDSYHFSKLGDFMFRSQLDARDSRLPGTGVFDLKTRAVIPIRMAVQDFEQVKGYEIRGTNGEYESFEREYHDMIRSAFLKYSLQVRMGRMDGIFVAYHNTERIFGFQYIPLTDMDLAVHGQSDTALGDQEFRVSMKLLNELLDMATERFPNTSLRVTCEMRTNKMYFFAEPVSEDELEAMDAASEAKAQKYMASMTSSSSQSSNENKTDESLAADESAIAEEERALEKTLADEAELESADLETEQDQQRGMSDADEEVTSGSSGSQGADHHPTRSQELEVEQKDKAHTSASSSSSKAAETLGADEALEEILTSQSADGAADAPSEASQKSSSDASPTVSTDNEAAGSNLLAVSVKITNTQNGVDVSRPGNFDSKSTWTVAYEIEEIKDSMQSVNTYNACKRRRALLLGVTGKRTEYNMNFIKNLAKLSRKGKAYRKQLTERDAGKEKLVLGR